jgi:hypothetical protein
MAQGGIRVGTSPREDGRALDDQIARADEATTQGSEHAEDKEGLGHRRARSITSRAYPQRRAATAYCALPKKDATSPQKWLCGREMRAIPAARTAIPGEKLGLNTARLKILVAS